MRSTLPRFAWPLALSCLLLAAFALRWLPSRERRLEGELPGASWVIQDERSAAHLRAIECALAGAGDARIDRYLGHPSGTQLPWSPPFDATLAVLAQAILPHSGGEAALRGIDETRLYDVVLRLPVWLGCLSVLLAAWAGRPLLRSQHAAWLALIAAACVAIAPAAVLVSRAGELDGLGWLLPIELLLIGLLLRALRATDALGAIIVPLLAAAASGLFLASSPLGWIGFAAGWAGMLAWSLQRDSEHAALGQRAGIAFTLASAFVARALEGRGDPSAIAEGALGAWNEAASMLVLLSVIPFLALMLLRTKRAARPGLVFIQLGALGVLLWISPGVLGGLRQGWQWYSERREVLNALVPGHAPLSAAGTWLALVAATPLVLATPLLVWMLLRRRLDPARVFLAALLALTFAAACIETRLFALLVPSLAIALVVCIDGWLSDPHEGGVGRPRANSALGAAVIGLVLLAHLAAALLTPPDLLRREEQIEFTRGLRWMREHTPSPGPWNAPQVAGEWGVLATPSVGAILALEARRPALASGVGIAGELEPLRTAALALLATEPPLLVRACQVNGVRYVVAGPRLTREIEPLERVREDPELEALRTPAERARVRPPLVPEATLLWKLSFAPADARADLFPGLERVYASARIVDAAGHAAHGAAPSGPAISIWKVAALSSELAPRLEAR